MTPSDQDKAIKKRNRVPLSCSNCRRKKIKCDRGKPICKMCQAHNFTDCVYYSRSSSVDVQEVVNTLVGNVHTANNVNGDANEIAAVITGSTIITGNGIHANVQKAPNEDPSAITSIQVEHAVSEQLTSMKSKIESLEKQLSEQKSMNRHNVAFHYSDYSYELIEKVRSFLTSMNLSPFDKIPVFSDCEPTIYFNSKYNNFGPFAWITIIKKDQFLLPIFKKVTQARREIVTNFQKITMSLLNIPDNKNYPKPTVAFEPYTDLNTNTVPSFNHKFSLNPKTLDLTRKIAQELPNKRAIWLFIQRFFKYVYPFVPYLDQETFIDDIERLIDGHSIDDLSKEEKVTYFNVSEHLDLAIIGTLLIVIKFAYESLLSTNREMMDPHNRSKDDQYLLQFKQGDSIVSLTNECLNEFSLIKRCSLPILQLAILFREYQKVDGCDAFQDGDSQIFTGLIIQIGNTIGLNRDPLSNNELTDGKAINLRRKIWYGLISSDNYQYTQTGTPPIIHPSHYDTRLPEFDENSSNVYDLKIERITIENIRKRFEIENKMRSLADLMSNMKQSPNVEHITLCIIDLEAELKHQFGTLDDLLLSNHGNIHHKKLEKVLNFIIYTNTLNLLKPVHMLVYYHCQQRENFEATYYIHNKILSFWMYLLSNLPELVGSSHTYFDIGFDVFLIPGLEVSLHKGLCFFMSTYVKCKIFIDLLKAEGSNDSELVNVVTFFKDNVLIRILSDIYIPILRQLSPKYFYSWRMLKSHQFILKCLRENSIDFSRRTHLFNFIEKLTVTDFKILIKTSDINTYKIGGNSPPWLPSWRNKYRKLQSIFLNEPLFDKGPVFSDELLSIDSSVGKYTLINTVPVNEEEEALEDRRWYEKLYEKMTINFNHRFDPSQVHANSMTMAPAFSPVPLPEKQLTSAPTLQSLKTKPQDLTPGDQQHYHQPQLQHQPQHHLQPLQRLVQQQFIQSSQPQLINTIPNAQSHAQISTSGMPLDGVMPEIPGPVQYIPQTLNHTGPEPLSATRETEDIFYMLDNAMNMDDIFILQ